MAAACPVSRQGLERDVFLAARPPQSDFFRDRRGVMLSFARMESRGKGFVELRK